MPGAASNGPRRGAGGGRRGVWRRSARERVVPRRCGTRRREIAEWGSSALDARVVLAPRRVRALPRGGCLARRSARRRARHPRAFRARPRGHSASSGSEPARRTRRRGSVRGGGTRGAQGFVRRRNNPRRRTAARPSVRSKPRRRRRPRATSPTRAFSGGRRSLAPINIGSRRSTRLAACSTSRSGNATGRS